MLTVQNLHTLRNEVKKKYSETANIQRDQIFIHMGTCGIASGAQHILETLENELEKKGFTDILITKTGCAGLCSLEPMITVDCSDTPAIRYINLTDEKVRKIIDSHIIGGQIVKEYALATGYEKNTPKFVHERENPRLPDEGSQIKVESIPDLNNVDFFKAQEPIVLKNRGQLDPDDIEAYIAYGGYSAIEKALTQMKPGDIINEIKISGLRGRGGAGFLTGSKWELCRHTSGDVKYIVCNADEGDPGAFMDRSILESDPHTVLEGMIIGACAIGASEGFIYVREEYPLAVKRINLAIKKAKEYGFLGTNILGSDFNFEVKVIRGAGAFVCGEETALIASIEGKVGRPRQRPPYPVQKGLWNKPTTINNVETWANVPNIINLGAKWFSNIGTEKSKGTKIFSLVGKVNNTGLVEVPMGITFRKIIFDIGGGIPGNKKFKAVQIGGPSGGCIPEKFLDTPIDYDQLVKIGAMMGSGGLIVMDETTCMVDVARYFTQFLYNESCGKCWSCREGLRRMLQILTDITMGQATENDLDTLRDLAEMTKNASMCGLGQTAANPVLTTLKYFEKEYILHTRYKRCTAKVCKSLITFYIIPERCTGCQRCFRACPTNAIQGTRLEPQEIDQSKCIKCRACYDTCKYNAIEDIIVDPVMIKQRGYL